jgi:hypothetical protein
MNVWGLTKKILGISMLVLPLTMSATLTGCLTEDDDDDTSGTGGTDSALVSKSTATLGAQSASQGSSLDLDAWTVWGITDAKANSTKVDLIFAYSTATTSAAIYSPNIAVNGTGGTGGFDFLNGFNNPRTTTIKKTSAAYASIGTRKQLDSAWAAGTAEADGKLDVAENMVFMAQSDMGKVVLLQVGNLVTGANGTVTLTAKAKAFD